MESIGEKLKHRREEKLYSIDQTARETHIAKRFIEAMEQERFEEFPGESYLIGFLRNYARFLELDSDEVVELYRNTQIQEQPSPVEELLDSRPRANPKLLLGILGGALAIAIGAVLITVIGNTEIQPRRQTADVPEQGDDNFELVSFTGEILEQEFEEQTAISIPFKGETYRLELREISTPLALHYGDESFTLEELASGFIDLDREGNPDLRIVYKSKMPNGNPVLRFDRVVAGAAVEADNRQNEAEQGGIRVGSTNDSSRVQPVRTIGQFTTSQPVFVEILFRGPVLFRYLDENGASEQQMLNSGERFQAELSEYMYIWLSNAGKVQFSLAGQIVRLGADGEAAAYKIAWNGNQLELIPMY